MRQGRGTRVLIKSGAFFTLAFLYVPLVVVVIYAFNKSRGASWPPQLFTMHWFTEAWRNDDVRGAISTSVVAASAATLLALLLGTLASFAVHRFKFFGRDAVSFILVLPIALPGIVTALALSSGVEQAHSWFGMDFGLAAIIIGHATFCVVVVYNNVIARLRRTPNSLLEASMDLGANGIKTFGWVMFPALRTSLIAGGLLAFGLSFDEVVVTLYLAGTKLTLPLWIYNNIQRAQSRPIVNVVALVVLLISIVPVWLAQRLAGSTEVVASRKETALEPGPG